MPIRSLSIVRYRVINVRRGGEAGVSEAGGETGVLDSRGETGVSPAPQAYAELAKSALHVLLKQCLRPMFVNQIE